MELFTNNSRNIFRGGFKSRKCDTSEINNTHNLAVYDIYAKRCFKKKKIKNMPNTCHLIKPSYPKLT